MKRRQEIFEFIDLVIKEDIMRKIFGLFLCILGVLVLGLGIYFPIYLSSTGFGNWITWFVWAVCIIAFTNLFIYHGIKRMKHND